MMNSTAAQPQPLRSCPLGFGRWKRTLADLVRHMAHAHGWRIEETNIAPNGCTLYLRLAHAERRRPLLVRLSDHPPRNYQGGMVSMTYPATSRSQMLRLVKALCSGNGEGEQDVPCALTTGLPDSLPRNRSITSENTIPARLAKHGEIT